MTDDVWRLLVVDDNEDNRYTLIERLARLGYSDVASAVDGRQALELLRGEAFDLVLLDIMMPGINGFQVLEAMRAEPKLRMIPVIVISAADQTDSAIRCIELGAVDYLPKPFNPTLLRARIGAVLEKKTLSDEIARHVDRIDRDLQLAREIQLSMVPVEFPSPTPSAPVSVYATLRPADEVGGDLYDVFWIAPGRLCLIVADVCGKGMPAALFTARTRTAIRLLSARAGDNPHDGSSVRELIALLNEELCRDNPHSMFVTLVLCIVDVDSGRVQWCNAGHPSPFVVPSDGTLERLCNDHGCPLGIPVPFDYVVGTATLAPGASLFLHTDGIMDAMNAQGEMFSQARLMQSLSAAAGRPPREMLDAVLADVLAFIGPTAPSDDIAAVVCEWRPGVEALSEPS